MTEKKSKTITEPIWGRRASSIVPVEVPLELAAKLLQLMEAELLIRRAQAGSWVELELVRHLSGSHGI